MDVNEFVAAARTLYAAGQDAGLTLPAFRSKPVRAGATRTIRRLPGGTVVSVLLRDRPADAIVADMIDGIIVANGLTGDDASRLRALLHETLF